MNILILFSKRLIRTACVSWRDTFSSRRRNALWFVTKMVMILGTYLARSKFYFAVSGLPVSVAGVGYESIRSECHGIDVESALLYPCVVTPALVGVAIECTSVAVCSVANAWSYAGQEFSSSSKEDVISPALCVIAGVGESLAWYSAIDLGDVFKGDGGAPVLVILLVGSCLSSHFKHFDQEQCVGRGVSAKMAALQIISLWSWLLVFPVPRGSHLFADCRRQPWLMHQIAPVRCGSLSLERGMLGEGWLRRCLSSLSSFLLALTL